jgi:hypothetical protein
MISVQTPRQITWRVPQQFPNAKQQEKQKRGARRDDRPA